MSIQDWGCIHTSSDGAANGGRRIRRSDIGSWSRCGSKNETLNFWKFVIHLLPFTTKTHCYWHWSLYFMTVLSPPRGAIVTQLQSRTVGLWKTSAHFAQTDNKECNFKRAPKGNGTDMIRAPLIESIIYSSWFHVGADGGGGGFSKIWNFSLN